MSNNWLSAAVIATMLACKYSVSGNQVTVQVFTATIVDQANIVTWAYAATAGVVGCLFTVTADGE